MGKENPASRISCEASGHRIYSIRLMCSFCKYELHPSIPCCFRPVNRPSEKRFAPRYNSLWLSLWLTSNWRVTRLRFRLAFLLVTAMIVYVLHCIMIRKYNENMTRYLLGQSLAHIKLFTAANICVKQAQNRGIWRRTGPSESLSMWLESLLPRQIQTAAVFRVDDVFIILF